MSKRKIEVHVKVKVNGELITGNWEKFVKREELEHEAGEQLSKKRKLENYIYRAKKMDLLNIVRTYLKEVSDVKWKEDGAIEEDDHSQYFYGSQYELKKEFDTEYTLELTIFFPRKEGPEEDDTGAHIYMRYFAIQDMDVGDDKVYFDTEDKFDVEVTGPCSLSPIQLKEMLIAVVKARVQQPMQSGILAYLEGIDSEDLDYET